MSNFLFLWYNSAMSPLIKRPSAWIPIAMPFAILGMMFYIVLTSGFVYHADEGAPARIFQLWLAIEFFSVVLFGVKWLPREPKQAIPIIAMQIVASLSACAPVFLLGL